MRALVAVTALAASTAASADLITYVFTGYVESITPPLPPPWAGLGVDDPITVTYTFDTDAEDIADAPDVGYYEQPHPILFESDGIAHADDSFRIDVYNDLPPDLYFVHTDVGEYQYNFVLFTLEVFDSDALPLIESLDPFDTKELVVHTDHDGSFYVQITGFTADAACPADCNADAQLSVLDFVCFQALFVDADPEADCNKDGVLNILDFVCFQQAFVAGCP